MINVALTFKIMNDISSLINIFIFSFLTINLHAHQKTIKVTIKQGTLRGGETKTDNGVTYYEFMGIPYARPPVGNLRFRNPQPPEPWHGERDATVVSSDNICCQLDMMNFTLIGSEDCLYLNVYTPKCPNSDRGLLPVMTYFHGGGFIYNNGIIKEETGPDYLIEYDVVVVTINYRLGVLGFLSLDIPEVSGNMGLKDQVQALKWIKNNIKQFGGDPNNVMIFGESAGSASVDYHILSPLSKGLFHKAILNSGSSLNHWAINYEPEKNLKRLLESMGYSGYPDDTRAVYDYLLTNSVSNIIEAAYNDIGNLSSNRITFGFVPVIEKVFGNNEEMITNISYKLFKEGKFNRVPVIKGFCKKEGYLAELVNPRLIFDVDKNKNFAHHFSYKMSKQDEIEINTKFSQVYPENQYPDEDGDELAIDFFGDLDIVAGSRVSGEIMANKDVPVYFYEFTYVGNINLLKNVFGINRTAAGHADDAGYVFKMPFSKLADEKDKEVRRNICKMWTNFAKTGDPTSSGVLFQWPNHTEDAPSYLSIGEKFMVESTFKPRKIDIFRDLYDKYKK